MDLHCPHCNSRNLKKLSLVYHEGLYRMETRSRLRGIVLGADGPDVVLGRATTTGFHQTKASKIASPPVKWSYVRTVLWAGVGLLGLTWLVFYSQAVSTNTRTVFAPSVTPYVAVSAVTFALVLLLVWRHNQYASRQYAQWDRSFVCERCGAISERELADISIP